MFFKAQQIEEVGPDAVQAIFGYIYPKMKALKE